PCAGARTHSARGLVLPPPRPPSASQVVHGPLLLAASGASWWRCASTAKSLSNLVHRRSSGISVSIGSVSPACDERVNAARKGATELVDVSWHVVVMEGLMVGEGACAQALQGLQGLRQRRERARAAFGGGGRALFAAEFSARRLLGFDLFQNEL